jgi:DNA-binding beta-propeller fold protein YncE
MLDREGNITNVTRVESGPVALAIDGATLWVAALDGGVLSKVGVADGATLQTLGRVGRPTGLSVGGGVVWVADAFGQTVTLVDVVTGDVRRTTDARLARQITYGFDSAWATDDIADRIIRFDRQTGDVATTTDLAPGAYPAGIATGLGAVWVANAGTSTLARIEPATTSVSEAGIALRATPDLVAVSSTDVWVTSRAADLVLRVDPTSNSVSATVAVDDAPVSIVADGDTIWVGCAGTREVWHIDREGKVLTRTNVGGVPAALAISGDTIFVAVHQP